MTIFLTNKQTGKHYEFSTTRDRECDQYDEDTRLFRVAVFYPSEDLECVVEDVKNGKKVETVARVEVRNDPNRGGRRSVNIATDEEFLYWVEE